MKGMTNLIKREDGANVTPVHSYDGPRLQRLNQEKKQQMTADPQSEKKPETPSKKSENPKLPITPNEKVRRSSILSKFGDFVSSSGSNFEKKPYIIVIFINFEHDLLVTSS